MHLLKKILTNINIKINNISRTGRNESGELGHGDTQRLDVPKVVESLKHKVVVKAACGRQHTLVLTQQGQVYAFGENLHGQLGLGWFQFKCFWNFYEILFLDTVWRIYLVFVIFIFNLFSFGFGLTWYSISCFYNYNFFLSLRLAPYNWL